MRSPGIALGVALALKFFLWPVVLWLVATGRRGAAGISAAIAVASLAPAPAVDRNPRLRPPAAKARRHVRRVVVHALRAARRPRAHRRSVARAVTLLLGAAVLALAWRRRSLGLAIAAALCLSPIVWRHFFAFLAVPLAISRPRFDAAWLLPLGLWVAPGTLNGDTWQTALVLVLAGLTVALAERPRARPRPAVATRPLAADM